MKCFILFTVVAFTFSFDVEAQTPQIAVVHPNGTTFICSNFDTAYNATANGDFIYLPGGFFTVTNPINKSIHIYGAGYNQDSSAATGITTLNSFTILDGASNGSLEGVKVNWTVGYCIGSIRFGSDTNTNPISGYLISNCNIIGGILFGSECSNVTIRNNLIGGYGCNNFPISVNGALSNSLVANNVITGYTTTGGPNLQITNNIFFWANPEIYGTIANYSSYENNIFQYGQSWNTSYSTFANNLGGSINGTENTFIGQVSETWNSTFVDPGSFNGYGYSYNLNNNYHVKVSSLAHNSGTDGTDRGIYGGAFPWIEGSIPANPHIYFKQIDQVTGSDGKLHIQVGVRANN